MQHCTLIMHRAFIRQTSSLFKEIFSSSMMCPQKSQTPKDINSMQEHTHTIGIQKTNAVDQKCALLLTSLIICAMPNFPSHQAYMLVLLAPWFNSQPVLDCCWEFRMWGYTNHRCTVESNAAFALSVFNTKRFTSKPVKTRDRSYSGPHSIFSWITALVVCNLCKPNPFMEESVQDMCVSGSRSIIDKQSIPVYTQQQSLCQSI